MLYLNLSHRLSPSSCPLAVLITVIITATLPSMRSSSYRHHYFSKILHKRPHAYFIMICQLCTLRSNCSSCCLSHAIKVGFGAQWLSSPLGVVTWPLLRGWARPPGSLLWECFMYSWWRHQMEAFSALLAICARNSPVDGALMFSLICTRINGWVNNGDAGDLRRHRAHYDVTIMWQPSCVYMVCLWMSLFETTMDIWAQKYVHQDDIHVFVFQFPKCDSLWRWKC